MSAITGIFSRNDKKIEPNIIWQMTTKLAHRGSDGSGVWCEGSVGLGHQLLWTTPESVYEKLPFFDEDSHLVITADARIDNRNELSKLLGIKDQNNMPDTHFILRSYEKWKDKCPEYLLGDFAFVIWDPIDEKLFCARDHMGVKPFYYYLSDDLFLFSSELKAFFDMPQIKLKINKEKLGLFLMEIEDNQSTFYKNFYSLTPAHSLIITKKNYKFRKYWELDSDLEISLDSEEDYIDNFLTIFEESIRCRLRSEFPIGFDLSGGLDSSSIVCMVKHLMDKHTINTKKINTFSFIPSKSRNNSEWNYINKVTKMDNIVPNFIPNDTISFLKDFETILQYQDQPFYSPFLTNMWKLCEKIHENKVKVQLRGTGGDSVISYGTFYFRELAVNFKWKKLINEIRNYALITNGNSFHIMLNVIFSLIPGKIKNLLHSNKERRPGTTILEKDFANKINAEQILDQLFWEPASEANSYKKYHHFLINRFSDLYELEEMDNIFAKHNIEPRYPFLDKRLIEFCYSLPTDMKVKFGWSRYILRAAMDGILPEEIQWRSSKAEANLIYKNNFLLNEKEEINRVINKKSEIIENYVNLEKIQLIQKNFYEGNDNSNLLYIWLVTQLSLWLQYIKLDDSSKNN